MLGHTTRNRFSDSNIFVKNLAQGFDGIATQQRPQALTMLKPVSTNTLILAGKNEKMKKLELFEDIFHTFLKCKRKGRTQLKLLTFMHIYNRKHYKRSKTYVYRTEKLLRTC